MFSYKTVVQNKPLSYFLAKKLVKVPLISFAWDAWGAMHVFHTNQIEATEL